MAISGGSVPLDVAVVDKKHVVAACLASTCALGVRLLTHAESPGPVGGAAVHRCFLLPTILLEILPVDSGSDRK